MPFTGEIFVKDLDLETEMLIEGNCWALNCAIFSILTGDLHHGSAQYLIEGTRIALTKYGYQTKLRIFRDKKFATLLNYQLLTLGFMIRQGDYHKDYLNVEKGLLKYLPKIKKEYIKKEHDKILDKDIYSIPYAYKKLGSLYFILYFLTEVNDVMSRMEADPIGTFMFKTLKKFKEFLNKKFKNLNPKQVIDYNQLFQEFLDENKYEKEIIINYQKAKLVTFLDIETMIKIGENEQIEFKEIVNESIHKDAIAFANTHGGKIIIGVSDKKEVKGITELTKKYRQAMNIIISNTKPSINPIITPQKVDGKEVLTIEIHEANDIISDNKNNVYVRKGDQNLKPSVEELKKLIERKSRLSKKE